MPGFRYGRALRAFVSLLPYPTRSRRTLTHFPPSCNALLCAALLCAALLAAVLAPPAAAQSQMRQVGSLRVATFNTYLLSNPFRCATKRHLWDAIGLSECLSKGELLGVTLDPEEIDDATDEIADAILSIQRDVDVIVLNEVWDERARRRLVARLAPVFPAYISKVDPGLSHPLDAVQLGLDMSDADFTAEDSGLMLFAKPGVTFLPFSGKPSELSGGVEGNIPHVRAETLRVSRITIDAMAAKSIAAVHVSQTVGGQEARAYLVFTHLQADGDNGDIREGQLRQIRSFIQDRVIDEAQAFDEELSRVLVLGDMNVDGMRAVVPTSLSTGAVNEEWIERFSPANPSLPLFDDLWATSTSEKDPGPTYPRSTLDSSSRYDYAMALHPRVDAGAGLGFCSQHMTVQLRSTHSDHRALVVDFNQPYPFCSPRTALQPALDAAVPQAHDGIEDAIRIDRPGAMQWFRFPLDSAATIEVTLTGEMPVRSQMYAAHDMTRPIAPVEHDGRTATYSVPEDFFIRVDGKSRAQAGDYSLAFARRRCLSAEKPCVLTPTLAQEAVFPAGNLLGLDDAAWFRIAITELPDSGKAQGVSIMLAGLDANLVPTLMLESDPTAPVESDTFSISGRGTVVTFAPTKVANYLLKIARGADKSGEPRVRARWNTNLTTIKVTKLICEDETDGVVGSEAGEDEIAHFVQYDGLTRRDPVSGYRDFDCNSTPDPEPAFAQVIRALKPVASWVEEQDDGSGDNASPQLLIPMLGEFQLEQRDQMLRWGFEGGLYQLWYHLLKGSSGRD